jgi:hypothetical protein
MFSDEITTSDMFLDMPSGSQLLYFHLGMNADDDGFIASPKMVMRAIGSSEDELKILFAKKFLLPFESGICVIKHWRINNQIRKDRYTETRYTREKTQLFIRENGTYSFNPEGAIPVPKGHFLPSGNHLATNGQPSIVKVSKGKVSKEKKGEKKIVELPSWLNVSKWEEWVAYRKERRLTCTPTTLTRQIAFLARFQAQHESIIEKSITNGWQGLFELNNGVSAKPTNVLKTDNRSKLVKAMQEKAEKNA